MEKNEGALFQVDVVLTDQDYLEYNMFWLTKSPYGQKETKTMRKILTIAFGLWIFAILLGGSFSIGAILKTIPPLAIYIIFQLFLNKFYFLLLKWQMKNLKKTGKMGYSPVATIDFFEERFVETTPDGKTEMNYSAVERISVVTDKIIYIHLNNIVSYLLPLSCFQTQEEYQAFLQFISGKCAQIDRY